MDLNLDTLKPEILAYLESAGFAVFHSTAGGLEGMPMVLWDTERHPDYQMFLDTARRADVKLVMFASDEFSEEDLTESVEQLDDCELEREERLDLENRLRALRKYIGVTCTLELAFDYQSRLYVYEIQPDWYEEYLNVRDEIETSLPASGPETDDLGGYFSRN